MESLRMGVAVTYNVLVFPCGSQPAIDLNFALRHSPVVQLFGASSIDDHGSFVYRNYIGGIPNIADGNFVEVFQSILHENEIDFIMPTHDSVALFLVERQKLFSAQVISSDLDTVSACRSKSLTYQRLQGHDFVPMVYDSPEEVRDFPVFIKPDNGQGGKQSYIVWDARELQTYAMRIPSPVITEYLPGEELTVDCFTDRFGQLRFVGPRTRDRTLAGISVRSEVAELTAEVMHMAQTINDELNFRGYWFFQVKRSSRGEYKLMEISSRMAGTSCLNISRGVNFPLLSILDRAELDIEVFNNHVHLKIDRSLVNRYSPKIQYDRVYLDLDKTLLVNGRVNVQVMTFLYQCMNLNKDVVLLTKCEGNIHRVLLQYKICSDLFSETIQLPKTSPKHIYIRDDMPSVLIDNSFHERKLAHQMCGIPTFDANSVEVLMDWRG